MGVAAIASFYVLHNLFWMYLCFFYYNDEYFSPKKHFACLTFPPPLECIDQTQVSILHWVAFKTNSQRRRGGGRGGGTLHRLRMLANTNMRTLASCFCAEVQWIWRDWLTRSYTAYLHPSPNGPTFKQDVAHLFLFLIWVDIVMDPTLSRMFNEIHL